MYVRAYLPILSSFYACYCQEKVCVNEIENQIWYVYENTEYGITNLKKKWIKTVRWQYDKLNTYYISKLYYIKEWEVV